MRVVSAKVRQALRVSIEFAVAHDGCDHARLVSVDAGGWGER